MKIMHVIHGLNTGGAETLVKNYALKFKKNLFDVVILCLEHCEDSPYERELKENNIRVIFAEDSLPFKRSKCIFTKAINHIFKYFIVRKQIRRENPDVLHTHLPINSYIKFAKISDKCKLFHTVHSEPNALWNNTRRRRKDLQSAKYLVKHKKMRFIVLHEKMRNEINEKFQVSNSIILNNGIDFSRFDKNLIKDRQSFRKELGIPTDAFVIGHIGRFNKLKNHKFLVEIFNNIYKKNHDAFLLLIGSGEERESTENQLRLLKLEKNYLILSNRNDIPDLLGVVDAFVFPSLFEGLPLTLIEAQKMGVPSFISNTINQDVIISNLITQISLEKDSNEWAETIINYRRPKKVVLHDQEWNMDNVVKRLEAIYKDEI